MTKITSISSYCGHIVICGSVNGHSVKATYLESKEVAAQKFQSYLNKLAANPLFKSV